MTAPSFPHFRAFLTLLACFALETIASGQATPGAFSSDVTIYPSTDTTPLAPNLILSGVASDAATAGSNNLTLQYTPIFDASLAGRGQLLTLDRSQLCAGRKRGEMAVSSRY